MRFRELLANFGVVSLLLWSSGALAAASDDVRTGASVYFRAGHITVEGNRYNETDWTLAKSPGSWDVNVDARSIGLDYDLTIRLRGSAVGSRIVWSFDETLPHPYEVGFSAHLRRIRGQLVGTVERVDDDTVPYCVTGACPYSVRIRNAGSSWVELSGSGPFWEPTWSRSITDLSFDLLAGVPRPILRDMDVSAPQHLCASNRARWYAGRVRITNPAPSGGGMVDVRSNVPSVLDTHRAHVNAGRTDGRFMLRIPPAWSGDIAIAASAGGASQTRLVSVQPLAKCLRITAYGLEPLLRDELYPCPTCIDAAHLSASGEASVRYAGKWLLVDANGKGYPADEIIGASVQDIIPGFYGELWGLQKTPKGLLSTFWVAPDQKQPKLFPELTLNGVSAFGLGVGTVFNGKATVAGFFNGSDLFELGFGEGSNIAAANTNSGLAGTLLEQGKVHGFAFDGKNSFDLGEAVQISRGGINEAGDITGWSVNAKKLEQGFVFSTFDAKLRPIKTLEGYTHSRAVGISDSGVVLANAYSADRKKSRVFLYTEEDGAIDLQKLVLDEGLTLIEGLSITGGGDLLVRALLDNAPAVLRLVRK